MLGITFKENCPDIRNTKAIDIYNELITYDTDVEVYDSWADAEEVRHEYGMNLSEAPSGKYDAIILAVAHDLFTDLNLNEYMKEQCVIYDIKGILPIDSVTSRL
jgi:UDP-N-acetyl-D-galactosamine dehydrogenase